MNFSFKNWLSESPLKYYGVRTHPDYDYNRNLGRTNPFKGIQKDISGYFSTGDEAIIKHPKTAKILEEKLKNIGYNVNIIFYEDINRTDRLQYAYVEKINKYIEKNNIQKEGHITFVKNSSSGDFLTPWMIFHTFGHAVNGYSKTQKPSLDEKISQCFSEYKIWSGSRYQSIKLGQMPVEDDLSKIFKFKSIKNKMPDGVPNFVELVHELIAEYLWNGKIRTTTSVYESFANCLETKIKESLDICVGNVIFDYF